MMLTSLKNHFKFGDNAAAIWQGSGEDVIAVHGPDGRFERLSDEASEVFGLPAERLMGRRLMDVVAPAHQERLLEALARVAESDGNGRARFDCRIRCGETLGAHVEIALSRAPRGRLRSVTRNIEHRLAREEQIRAESAKVIENTSKQSEHLANVSHEIRTPLNAVIGFADAISAERFGPMGNEKYRDYARVIQESGQHLLALITDLLDLSKAEANATHLEKTAESPAALVSLCAEMIRLQASDVGLYIRTQIDPEVGQVLLDAKIVRQILLNVLSNALKFTERGGITISLRREGGQLIFTVVDTGVGMSPDDLSRIGERFTQARSEGVRGARGTGIGLSLSKALARVHGGELQLMSVMGQGTTAILSLPYEAVKKKTTPTPEEIESNIMAFSDIKRA